MGKKRGRSKSSSAESDVTIMKKPDNKQGSEDVQRDSKESPSSKPQKNRKQKKESQSKPNSALLFDNVQPSLSKGVIDFVRKQKFVSMTPVQSATIPLFLSHKDVAVQACTGSGKTLAFLIPMVEMILKRKNPFKRKQVAGITLSPTRELALQTYSVATELCEAVSLPPPLLLVGGSTGGGGTNHRPVTQDLETFAKQGNDILIATPGRLEDILTRYMVLDVSEMECLVLDEADVLLKMGFAVSLTNILSKLPKMRRTGLFSATAAGLKEWVPRAGLRNPVWVNVTVAVPQQEQHQQQSAGIPLEQATPATLTNYYLVCPQEEKLSRLCAFLESHPNDKIIVFFLTCACVEFYGAVLQCLLPKHHYVELLHGKLVQKRREKAMERFRLAQNSGVLCCTDVAARGLDVSDINWVTQFDAPQDPAFFVHRVGRAARAGRQGSSLLLLTRKEEAYVDLMKMRKVPLEPLPTTERCCPPSAEESHEGDNDSKPSESADMNKKKKGKPASSSDVSEARLIQSASDPQLRLPDALPKVKSMVLKDRDLLEKGTKAFTSYIRAYKEHQCAFIFRFASLDLGHLATSFCLLRLPKMPELRDILNKHKGRLPHFSPASPEIDIYAIPYLEKTRETARQKRLQAELEAGGKNAKQIKAEQRKAAQLAKEKDRRQDAINKGRNPDKKRGKHAQIVDEWDELAKEERLHKKLRRGKITQAEFDEEMFGTSG